MPYITPITLLRKLLPLHLAAPSFQPFLLFNIPRLCVSVSLKSYDLVSLFLSATTARTTYLATRTTTQPGSYSHSKTLLFFSFVWFSPMSRTSTGQEGDFLFSIFFGLGVCFFVLTRGNSYPGFFYISLLLRGFGGGREKGRGKSSFLIEVCIIL